MNLPLNDFKAFYKLNSKQMHINFCKPIWDLEKIDEKAFRAIDRAIVGIQGFSRKIKGLKELKPGVTNGLADAFDDLIPVQDLLLFQQEEIEKFNNSQGEVVAALRYTTNKYTGQHYKVLGYGVVLGQTFLPGRPAIYLQMTFAIWALITKVSIQLVNDHTQIEVCYIPETYENSYYSMNMGHITVISFMNSSNSFEIYFIPN